MECGCACVYGLSLSSTWVVSVQNLVVREWSDLSTPPPHLFFGWWLQRANTPPKSTHAGAGGERRREAGYMVAPPSVRFLGWGVRVGVDYDCNRRCSHHIYGRAVRGSRDAVRFRYRQRDRRRPQPTAATEHRLAIGCHVGCNGRSFPLPAIDC